MEHSIWTHKVKLINREITRRAYKLLVYETGKNGLIPKPGYAIEDGGPFGVMTVPADHPVIENVELKF